MDLCLYAKLMLFSPLVICRFRAGLSVSMSISLTVCIEDVLEVQEKAEMLHATVLTWK